MSPVITAALLDPVLGISIGDIHTSRSQTENSAPVIQTLNELMKMQKFCNGE